MPLYLGHGLRQTDTIDISKNAFTSLIITMKGIARPFDDIRIEMLSKYSISIFLSSSYAVIRDSYLLTTILNYTICSFFKIETKTHDAINITVKVTTYNLQHTLVKLSPEAY